MQTAPNYGSPPFLFRDAFLLVAGNLLCLALTASAATLYVDLSNLAPASPYTNWATAAANIQDAVDAAGTGDEIVVTNGVYQSGARAVYGMSNRVAVTRSVTVRSVNGPAVTQIVGYQMPGPWHGPSAVRCVYLANGAVLEGFTLTNGATPGQFDFNTNRFGGGVWCEGPSAVVSNCVLTGNSAYDCGGGAYGGTLNSCTFTGNSAYRGGGAYGGTLNNCTLKGNSAFSGGGADKGTLNNCTLTGNSAYYGGGISDGTLNNCIVYYNFAHYGGHNYLYGTLNYCCTAPDPPGLGNIGGLPLFVDQTAGNLRLQSNSPCINAGNNASAPGPCDLDDNPRIAGGRVDIGAYEFQGAGLSGFTAWLWHYGLPTDGSADRADNDFEGMNNWQEWVADTNPTNAASALRMLSLSNAATGIAAVWSTVSTRTYSLERATDLHATPAFGLICSNLAGLAGSASFTDTNAIGPGPFFYRIRVEQ